MSKLICTFNKAEIREAVQLLPKFAACSPDPSRKTACVIMLARGNYISGYNTFPEGVAPRLERPAKYAYIEHAERNAIYFAAAHGYAVQDSTMFLAWYPCADCARAIVCSGIVQLFVVEPDWTEERYGFRDAEAILKEGGVEVKFYDRSLLGGD